jgi:hypothetical protein
MNLHRLLVDVGFERIRWVGKRRQRMSHRTILLNRVDQDGRTRGSYFSGVAAATAAGRP